MAGQAQVKAQIDSVQAKVNTQNKDAQENIETSQSRRIEAQVGRCEDGQKEIMASIKAVQTAMYAGQEEVRALSKAISATDLKVEKLLKKKSQSK